MLFHENSSLGGHWRGRPFARKDIWAKGHLVASAASVLTAAEPARSVKWLLAQRVLRIVRSAATAPCRRRPVALANLPPAQYVCRFERSRREIMPHRGHRDHRPQDRRAVAYREPCAIDAPSVGGEAPRLAELKARSDYAVYLNLFERTKLAPDGFTTTTSTVAAPAGDLGIRPAADMPSGATVKSSMAPPPSFTLALGSMP